MKCIAVSLSPVVLFTSVFTYLPQIRFDPVHQVGLYIFHQVFIATISLVIAAYSQSTFPKRRLGFAVFLFYLQTFFTTLEIDQVRRFSSPEQKNLRLATLYMSLLKCLSAIIILFLEKT